MFRMINCLLSVAVLCAMSTVCDAALMTNSSTSAVVLDDGFEGATVGTIPGSPWNGGHYDGGANSVLEVCDLASEGFDAYEGSKFVKLSRPDEYGGVYLEGVGTAANSGDGDDILLKIAFRIDGTQSSLYAMTNGATMAQFGVFGNGDVGIVTPDGQAWDIFDETANVGQWNELVITHTNGVDAWSASINGAAFETPRLGAAGMSAGAFTGIMMQTDSPSSTAYWDAVPVPEPSSVVLLMTAITGLLAYAWRKRK